VTQPWLYSRAADLVFILAPAFAVAAALELFPGRFAGSASPWMWLLLVVGVDVAHVYSTLYRTYFDPDARRKYQTVLTVIPVACWIGGVILYSFGAMTFWRVLAYVAVFHFVRQQYGFLRLYSRRDPAPPWKRRLDAAAIYSAALYPLIYWHTHPRSFQWFVKGDFLRWDAPSVAGIAQWIYLAILAAYAISEIRTGRWNAPKNLILLGTGLSWYFGIVRHNGDLTFTLTNVVAHGVPYMALVWMYERKSQGVRWYSPAAVFVGFVAVLAYVEEGFWDVLVWRDHTQFFQWLAFLPQLNHPALLAVVVPLLALPQATHYVLDGFIWRVRDLSAV
jgi:hypothetical protein